MAKKSVYESINKARKIAKIQTQAAEAKKFFDTALKRKSIESKQARAGRQLVKGISRSLKRGSGNGAAPILRFRRVSAGWSDMGLVGGSPFKEYRSRNVFPNSSVDRQLHPQEKAEIDALIQKTRLFGQRPSQLSKDNNTTKDEV